MNPNRTEWAPPVGLTAADLGEAIVKKIIPSIDEEWALISYLKQPLPIHSRLDYVVMSFADSVPVSPPSVACDLSYEWTVTNPSGWVFQHSESDEGVFNWTCKAPGTYEIKVVVTSDGREIVTLALSQTAQEPGLEWRTANAAVLNGSNTTAAQLSSELFAMHEICVDLHDEIVAAAAATGANGVPARLVAAAMYMEACGHPKDGSPGADVIQARLAGSWYTPRIDAAYEKFQHWRGEVDLLAPKHLHDIREVELDLIREFLNEVNPIDRRYMGRKSIGFGQMAMTTAAMILGEIPWTEFTEGKRDQVLETIEDQYRDLPIETKVDIFNSLRFPKRNAWMAAQLLAKLKNRPHRFPGLTAQQVLTDLNAIEIIETEYNRGAYDTPLATMKGNHQGSMAKRYVADDGAGFIGLEKFF